MTDVAALGRTAYTGEQYLESLRDGREIWIDGERVDDMTTHPAFRNAARASSPHRKSSLMRAAFPTAACSGA